MNSRYSAVIPEPYANRYRSPSTRYTCSGIGTAELPRGFDDRLKYSLKIRCRSSDDGKNLACRTELLAHLSQLISQPFGLGCYLRMNGRVLIGRLSLVPLDHSATPLRGVPERVTFAPVSSHGNRQTTGERCRSRAARRACHVLLAPDGILTATNSPSLGIHSGRNTVDRPRLTALSSPDEAIADDARAQRPRPYQRCPMSLLLSRSWTHWSRSSLASRVPARTVR